MPDTTQPEPAEGAPINDPTAKPGNSGRSAQTPAEGGDAVAPPQPGSPRG